MGRHLEGMGAGPAGAHHGDGGGAQQRSVAMQVEENGRVRDFTQEGGKGRVLPEEDIRVKGARAVPFPPGASAPGFTRELCGLAPVEARAGPLRGVMDRLIGGAEKAEQARTGARPDAPAMAQGERCPVFGASGLAQGREAARPGALRLFLPVAAQCATPMARARRAASELGNCVISVRYFSAAAVLSPRRLMVIPALSRASAFLWCCG